MSDDRPAGETPRPDEDARPVPLVFVDLDTTPILYANHFIVQTVPGGILLTVGQFGPPILVGTPEEIRQQAERIQDVPVHTVARLLIPLDSSSRLVEFLQQQSKRSASSEATDDTNGST